MSGRRDAFASSVFINCPFDDEYWPTFEALVFTVVACHFNPRCALEELDSGTVRLTKIQRIIQACRFGIHDLSRVELAASNSLRLRQGGSGACDHPASVRPICGMAS